MPRKNTIKTYLENGIYHVYNRGVEKRNIFMDDYDYKVFINILKTSLSPPPDQKTLHKTVTFKGSTFKGIPRQPKNFHQKIQLFAYCLMPNHFHFLLKQPEKDNLNKFMQSMIVRYSMFFNNKYNRVGSLFQSVYKAVLVLEEPYLLHLSRYIHRNPLEISKNFNYSYSSYGDYLKKRDTNWLNSDFILSMFNSNNPSLAKPINSYKNFVEETDLEYKENLENLALDF